MPNAQHETDAAPDSQPAPQSPAPPPGGEWAVVARTVRGASHLVDGKPNQDAFAVSQPPAEPSGLPILAAVSDGHGDPRSFRSATGSRFAADAALAVLAEFLAGFDAGAAVPPSVLKRRAEERLPRALCERWSAAVDAHLAANPFQADEFAALAAADAEGTGADDVRANPRLAYGATLLAVAVAPRFMIGVQIGDGDVLLTVPGQAPAAPIPGDERLIGTDATSLCARGAWADFRVAYVRFHAGPPRMISLSTDGVGMSFADDENFHLWLNQRMDALDAPVPAHEIEARLDDHLNELSRDGSGDDATIVMIHRRAS